MNPRSSLYLGVLTAASLAAVFGYFILQRFAPDAALARACVDGGLLVLLGLVVYSFTRTPAHRVDDLADAIGELMRGNRSRRLDPAEYGELQPIARAFNDIAAYLAAQEDPNLGPIKRRPRLRGADGEDSGPQTPPNEAENPEVSMRIRDLGELGKNHSYHPELGPVRVLKNDGKEDLSTSDVKEKTLSAGNNAQQEKRGEDIPLSQTAEGSGEHEDGDAAETAATGPDADRNSTLRLVTNEYTRNGTEIPQRAAPFIPSPTHEDETNEEDRLGNDTDIDALVALADQVTDEAGSHEAMPVANGASALAAAMASGGGNIASLPPESTSSIPHLSDAERMRALFEAFVQAKQEHEEPVEDLEFDAFATMVAEERLKLQQTHECRDVRFEVTVSSGEVSLLPRLLR